jgi:hypothetical protein
MAKTGVQRKRDTVYKNSLSVLVFLKALSWKLWKHPQMRRKTFQEGLNITGFT